MGRTNRVALAALVCLFPVFGEVVFERNAGQYRDPEVLYVARAGRTVASLGKRSVAWPGGLRMEFVNAGAAKLEALDEKPGRTNYLTGADPARWRRGINNFGAVRYTGLYPGIDMVFHANRGKLESDFIVAPGADPSRIRLRIRGSRGLKLNEGGSLLIEAAQSPLEFRKPVAFESNGKSRKPVEVSYEVARGGEVRLRVAPYSRSSTLVIDPEIVFASYLGGGTASGNPAIDSAAAVALDAAGMIYIAGYTVALDFPVKDPIDSPELFDNGYYYEDIFLSKIDPATGALVYSTILGGAGTDAAFGLAVDEEGAVYLAGRASAGFPYTAKFDPACDEMAARTAFALKLSPRGDQIEYADCLCGWADATSLALGPGKALFTAGYYLSGAQPALPVTPNAFQAEMPPASRKAFMVKLDAAGELTYATWLSGNGQDTPLSLAADAGGGVVILGATTSNTFPTVNALQPRNSSGGGINWSGDGGATWSARNSGLTDNSFLQIAPDPSTAGTAYAASRNAGIFVTRDFGLTWTPVPNSLRVTELAVGAQSPGLMYALSAGRLLRSDNGGSDWVPLSLESASPQSVVAGGKGDTVYVTAAAPPQTGAAGPPRFLVLRSDDRGATWTEIAKDLQLMTLPKVVVDPAQDGALYLIGNGYYRSADRGATWQTITVKSFQVGIYPLGLGLAADTKAPGVFYVDAAAPPVSAGTSNSGTLLKTTDGGNSWTGCGSFPETPQWFWVDPADSAVVYAASRQALYRSADGCATFERRTAGLPGRYFSWVAYDALSPANLYVASQPAEDLFLTRLNADGAAVFSTYLGTWEADYAAAMALEPNGDIWLTGYTTSAEWPTTASALQASKGAASREEVFLSRLSATGDAILYSTYIGGSEADVSTSVAVTPAGDVCLAGGTFSPDFPLKEPIQDSLKSLDAFLSCLSAEGALKFSTFLGGTAYDEIAAIKADRAGDLHLVGVTNSSDLPTSPSAFQPQFAGGGQDVFVLKIAMH